MLIAKTDIEIKIFNLVRKVLLAMNFSIVRVLFKKHTGDSTVQIMIERDCGTPISIQDCSNASKVIRKVLDVENIAKRNYTLEVTSCGINRPITSVTDFKKFLGRKVHIKQSSLDQLSSIKGTLIDVGDEGITIDYKSNIYSVNFNSIADAKLIGETI
ncbi:MAG: ribosome maturation factor RimP [Proteobacteria bacterium]|nr:ribosome maturation factor RimP [Pseudomonadota bacterium]